MALVRIMNRWRQRWRTALGVGLILGWFVLCLLALRQPSPGKDVALIVLHLVGAVFFGVLAGSWRKALRSPFVPVLLLSAATSLNSLVRFAFPLPMGPTGLWIGLARSLVLPLPLIVWILWALWAGKRERRSQE